MAYSEEDLESVYDTSTQDSELEVVVWNSGTVYFDDEVVEYQGKHYIALTKTISEVPGRSKPGIWRELTEEDVSNNDVDFDDYSEMKTQDSDISKVQKPAKVKQTDEKPSTQVHKPKTQSEHVSKKIEKPSTSPKRATHKAVNKPLAKKKTLQQIDDEKRGIKVKPLRIEPETKIQHIKKKMTLEPTDQHIVNEVLKEMDFAKIKGLNLDDHNIISDLILAQQIGPEITLSWESSHPSIISSKGKVTRPQDGHDIAVNISLRVQKNTTSSTRFFTLWVKAAEKTYSDEECVDLVYDTLNFNHIKGKNLQVKSISHDLELVNEGLYNTEIIWASKNRELLDEVGHFHKEKIEKDINVRLYAIIVKNKAERLKFFDLILKG